MIDLNPKHLKTIQSILAAYIPTYEVRAFGSRVKWTAKDYSDLDLAVVGNEPLSLRQRGQLAEAFEESNLPIRVDVLDWQSISERFRQVILERYEVIQKAEPVNQNENPEGINGNFSTKTEWEVKVFGDCAALIRESVSPSDLGDTPYIGLEHIGDNTLSLVGQGVASSVTSTKSRFRQGDILFGKLRCYFRKVVRAPCDGVCSTDIWVTRAKKGVDQGFLYYCMASQSFVDFADSGSIGTRMPRAKWEWVSRYKIPLPPLSEQRRIAHILGTLDDEIELNRQMNETLEAMARAIFKSWFVNFDPVKAKMEGKKPVGMDAETAALFPSAFEDSPQGKIPKGWKIRTLGDLSHKPQYGYTASAKNEIVGPKFLRITDINKKSWIQWDSVPYCEITDEDFDKYCLHKGDILIARMADPGHGIVIEEEQEAVFASYLIRFRPILDLYAHFLQYWLRSNNYWELVRGREIGTTRASLNAKTLSGFPIIIPPQSVIEMFSNQIASLRARVVANASEVKLLATLRDTLLPKLLSGEIRIDSIDKTFGENLDVPANCSPH